MAGVLRSDWIGPEPEAFRTAQSRGCHVFRLWQEGLLRAGLLSLAEAIGTERPSVRLRLVIADLAWMQTRAPYVNVCASTAAQLTNRALAEAAGVSPTSQRNAWGLSSRSLAWWEE